MCSSVNATVRQARTNKERVEQQLEAPRRNLGVYVHLMFWAVTEGVLKIKALKQAVHSTGQVAISSRWSFKVGSRAKAERGGWVKKYHDQSWYFFILA